MIGPTSGKKLLIFGDEPMPDTDSEWLFYLPQHCEIRDF